MPKVSKTSRKSAEGLRALSHLLHVHIVVIYN
jgi:hypothetical protein